MSETDRAFCIDCERGGVGGNAWRGGRLAFHGMAGESLQQVLVIAEDYVAAPEEIGRLPVGRARYTAVAESGYSVRHKDDSHAVQETFLHSHVVCGRRLETR